MGQCTQNFRLEIYPKFLNLMKEQIITSKNITEKITETKPVK